MIHDYMFNKLNKPIFVLLVIAVIFGAVYFWLVTPINTGQNIGHRFDWPDEVANYFFIENLAKTGELYVSEPLNSVAKNQVHPRSFNVKNNGSLVPGSFLGLILLYGFLAKIFGVGLIIYITPILAILGSLAFYGIIKRIFDEKIALLSLVLMLFHPAWWYYSVTSMLPNVCFVSLVIISVWLLFFKETKITFPQILLSAFSLGLAISIRPVEIIWIVALYFLLSIYLFRKLDWKKIVLFFAILFITLSPSFYQQKALFGNILTSGYDQLHIQQSLFKQVSGSFQSFIAPFGIHPRITTNNLWLYFFKEFWWLSFLAVLGLIFILFDLIKKTGLVFGYVLFSLFLFFWLGNFYGSWQFTDELTMKLNVLGLSYFRYWLPIYVISIPFIAGGLIWIINFFKTNAIKKIVLFIFVIFLFYNSATLVLSKNDDSIIPVRKRIAEYKKTASEVFSLTEPNSVIITIRKDKVFFPERKVIHSFYDLPENPELLEILPGLVNEAPVYYYSLGFEKNLNLENKMSLELVKNINQEVLYKIK